MSDAYEFEGSKTRTIPVWSRFVRVFHWTLVAAFFVAWLFPDDDFETIHRYAGYTVAALIAARMAVGVFGSGTARFDRFVAAPRSVLRYLKDMAARREARYLGHNPAGGAMIVAHLVTLSGICLSGWLLTDLYWGSALLEQVHEWLTNLALVLIALHVAGVLLASFRHRENLLAAMITGRKRAPGDGDVV